MHDKWKEDRFFKRDSDLAMSDMLGSLKGDRDWLLCAV